VLRLSREQMKDIPAGSVMGMKENAFGAEMLVRRSEVSDAFHTEHTTLEDIILFMAKGAQD